MKIFLAILFIALLVLLQAAALPAFNLGLLTPNLFLITLTWLALNRSPRKTYFTAVLGGLLFDVFSGGAFGVYLLSFLSAAGLLLLATTVLVPKENSLPLVLAGFFFASLIFQGLAFLLNWSLAYYALSPVVDWKNYFGVFALAQLALGYFLFYPVAYLAKKML
jgi:rod shape-determining protein MreD